MAEKASEEAQALLEEAHATKIQAARRGMSSRQDFRAAMAARETDQAANAAELQAAQEAADADAAAKAFVPEKESVAEAARTAATAKAAEEKAEDRAHKEADKAKKPTVEAVAARTAEEDAGLQRAKVEAAAAGADKRGRGGRRGQLCNPNRRKDQLSEQQSEHEPAGLYQRRG